MLPADRSSRWRRRRRRRFSGPKVPLKLGRSTACRSPGARGDATIAKLFDFDCESAIVARGPSLSAVLTAPQLGGRKPDIGAGCFFGRMLYGIGRGIAMSKFRILGMLAAAGILAGCTSDIDTLRNTQGTGSPFTKALTDEYRQMAVNEADEYDWPDASYFARKGLSAANGQVVLPEEPGAWWLPPDKADEITQDRARLIQDLDNGGRDRAPEIAAPAPGRLDSWGGGQEQ